MMELPKGNIALSSYYESHPIFIIIDNLFCQILTLIQLPEYFKNELSSLCALDGHSFIYGYDNALFHISRIDDAILYL